MCERRNHLLGVYQLTADALVLLVRILDASIALSNNLADHHYVRRHIDEAFSMTEKARTTLDKHIEEHGCGAVEESTRTKTE